MIAADSRPTLLYADRGAAEQDAEIFRRRNARDVERSRSRINCQTEPATYAVIEFIPGSDTEHVAPPNGDRNDMRSATPFA
jgi:hypothetical protein